MKNKRNRILVAVFILILSLFVYVFYIRSKPEIVYISGTVTSYDESPSAYDGSIIFSIDNKPVDIGGGLRPPDTVFGNVYSPIKIGDKVDSKLIKTKDGNLTIFDCSSCYIRKQKN